MRRWSKLHVSGTKYSNLCLRFGRMVLFPLISKCFGSHCLLGKPFIKPKPAFTGLPDINGTTSFCVDECDRSLGFRHHCLLLQGENNGGSVVAAGLDIVLTICDDKLVHPSETVSGRFNAQ